MAETETYTCKYCGFQESWSAFDDVHGEMWGCEECGSAFCSKCFIDRHGRDHYMRMMQGHGRFYCPDCYEKTIIKTNAKEAV